MMQLEQGDNPKMPDESISPVVQAHGTLSLAIPESVPEASFSAAEVGSHQEISGWRVQLDELDGHWVRILLTVPETIDEDEASDYLSRMELEARDKSGQFLFRSSTGTTVGDDRMLIDMLDQLIDVAESEEVN